MNTNQLCLRGNVMIYSQERLISWGTNQKDAGQRFIHAHTDKLRRLHKTLSLW